MKVTFQMSCNFFLSLSPPPPEWINDPVQKRDTLLLNPTNVSAAPALQSVNLFFCRSNRAQCLGRFNSRIKTMLPGREWRQMEILTICRSYCFDLPCLFIFLKKPFVSETLKLLSLPPPFLLLPAFQAIMPN